MKGMTAKTNSKCRHPDLSRLQRGQAKTRRWPKGVGKQGANFLKDKRGPAAHCPPEKIARGCVDREGRTRNLETVSPSQSLSLKWA